MSKRQVVIVCGYGCHMHPVYENYLSRVVRFVNENQVDLVVVSGGYSQRRTAPDRSEAGAMKSFLQDKIGINVIEENNALTTNENLKNVAQFLQGKIKPESHSLVIFCDAIRALKVKTIAERVFWEYDIQVETYDMSPKGATKRQILASLEDVLASYFPVINSVRRKIRERRAQTI